MRTFILRRFKEEVPEKGALGDADIEESWQVLEEDEGFIDAVELLRKYGSESDPVLSHNDKSLKRLYNVKLEYFRDSGKKIKATQRYVCS